jgi:hypothetical protein
MFNIRFWRLSVKNQSRRAGFHHSKREITDSAKIIRLTKIVKIPSKRAGFRHPKTGSFFINGGETGIRTLGATFVAHSLSRRAPSANSAISPKKFSKNNIKIA